MPRRWWQSPSGPLGGYGSAPSRRGPHRLHSLPSCSTPDPCEGSFLPDRHPLDVDELFNQLLGASSSSALRRESSALQLTQAVTIGAAHCMQNRAPAGFSRLQAGHATPASCWATPYRAYTAAAWERDLATSGRKVLAAVACAPW